MQGRGIAVAALALGLVGLFSLGGLGVGSLLGLVLAGIALVRGSRAGRDVAWAAVAANVFALLTIIPAGAGLLIHAASPSYPIDDGALPEPAQDPLEGLAADLPLAPPPPPPPPASRRDGPPAKRRADSGARPTPIRAGGAVEEPRKLRHVNPVYPPEARAARLQGVVVLECTISETGAVVEVKALRGVPLLTEAAVAAVKQWQYSPTVLNGVAVPVVMTVTVNFKLS